MLCCASAIFGGILGMCLVYFTQRRRRKHAQRLFYDTMFRFAQHDKVITDDFLQEVKQRGEAIIAMM